MTNWNAVQGVQSMIDGVKARREMGDVNIKQMMMGSWHANLSKGAAFNDSKRGGGKPKGKCKIKRLIPPIGGWTGKE